MSTSTKPRVSHSDLHVEMERDTSIALTALLHDLIRSSGDYRWAEVEELELAADDSLGTTSEHRKSLNEILTKIWSLARPGSDDVPTWPSEDEREAWEQEQLAMTQDEINAEHELDLFFGTPQSSKTHIKMSSRPTTMLSVDKLRVCACKKTGTKRANGFMLDKEGEWHCDGCYASVRDKYRGARQPSADDESEVEEDALDMTTLAAALPVAAPAPTVEETLRARIAELEAELAAHKKEHEDCRGPAGTYPDCKDESIVPGKEPSEFVKIIAHFDGPEYIWKISRAALAIAEQAASDDKEAWYVKWGTLRYLNKDGEEEEMQPIREHESECKHPEALFMETWDECEDDE